MTGDPAACADVADVAVVIPTVGRPDLLRSAVRSVEACSPAPAQVVIVDQGDGAASRAASEVVPASRLTIVRQPRLGIAAATNAGLRAARHEVVLATHDDCTVRDDWMAVGARLAARHPAAILTGRVLPAGDPAKVPSTITNGEPRDYTGTLTHMGLYPACMVLPRQPVLDIGGFDERFLTASEDNDLCYRWLSAGGELRFEPQLTVWHHDWRTERQLRALYRRYWYGQGLLYAKHLRRLDYNMLRFLGRDVRWFAMRPLELALGRRRPGIDPRTRGVTGLSLGLLHGITATRIGSRVEFPRHEDAKAH
jgi:GT2 family glycosyltransferase